MEGTERLKRLSAGTKRVFAYMLRHGEVTKTDIGHSLGKTPMFVNRALWPLEEAGLIEECGIGPSTGGRKPILYRVRTDVYYIGAVNISTTYCEVAVMDLRFTVLAIDRFKLNAASRPWAVIEQIGEVLEQEIGQLGIGREQLLGAGVSVFSSVNPETGCLLRPMIMYLDEAWSDYPLAAELKKRLGIELVFEKGTNAAALLEYHYGKARDRQRMLYILCAMNIRSAVMINGELQSVEPYYEDAFGHMIINFDGEACPCGRYGCVDCYTTIPAITEQFELGIKKGRDSMVEIPAGGRVNFRDICVAAEEGDSLSREVVISAASMLGLALSNYITLFCPDIVILSGLLVRESPLYFQVAAESARQKSSHIASERQVVFEKDGQFAHSITVGAGAILLERLID